MSSFRMRVQSVLANYQNMGLIQGNLNENMRNMIQVQRSQWPRYGKNQSSECQANRTTRLKDELRKQIRSQFENDKGEFDADLYQKILVNRLGTTPGQFETDQAEFLVAQKFDGLLSDSATVTEDELRADYKARNEKVNLWYAELTPQAIRGKLNIQKPSQSEIETYYKENAATYKLPEARKLKISWVALQDLSVPSGKRLSQFDG